MTDEELLESVKENDKKSFDILYTRYWEIIYKKSFVYLHDTDKCIEIVNDIFLNIWNKRHELHIIVFKNYITSAARYRVYTALKQRKAERVNYIGNYEDHTSHLIVLNHAEENLANQELLSDIDSLLDQLPKRCKEIFLLSRVNQLTNEEIANKLLVSKRTVENQISIAVKFLRKNMGLFFIITLQAIYLLHLACRV